MSISAYARWSRIYRCDPVLTISGTTATCKLKVETTNASDIIKATLELKNSSGTVLKRWTSLNATGYLNFSDTYSPISSGTYSLIATVTASGTSGSETITVTVNAAK